MKRKSNTQKELEELSPFLAKMKQKENYTVPANYFDNLADKVLNQVEPIQTTAKETVAKRSWFDDLIISIQALFQPTYALRLASVAILLAAGIWFFQKDSATSDFPSDEAIAAYIVDNIDDFEEELLAESWNEPEGDLLFENIDDSALDQYMDSVIDEVNLEELEDLL